MLSLSRFIGLRCSPVQVVGERGATRTRDGLSLRLLRAASRLNSEINKTIADPVVRKNLLDSAQEPIGGTSDQFAALVREDYATFGRLVKDLDIKAE